MSFTRSTGFVRAALVGAVLAPAAAGAPFTIGVLPDTQTFVYGWANKDNPLNPINVKGLPAVFPVLQTFQTVNILEGQTQWLADHAAGLNLVYVGHVGDITQGSLERDEPAENDEPLHNLSVQWDVAQAAMDVLKQAGVPFGVTIGNHDDTEDGYNVTELWREHLGASSGFFDGLPWHGGFSADERNSFQLIDVGPNQILCLCLDYRENEGERLAYAQQVIDAHRGTPTIIVTHKDLNEQGEFEAAGQELLDQVVDPNPQVFMLFSGHYTTASFFEVLLGGVDGTAEQFLITQNDAGQPVYHLLANYQAANPLDAAYLRLVEFDPDANQVNVKSYSAVYDMFQTDADSEFSFELDFTGRLGWVVGCPEDLDGDLVITSGDLNILLANFGQPGTPAEGDINGNGVIESVDLNALLSAFGLGCAG